MNTFDAAVARIRAALGAPPEDLDAMSGRFRDLAERVPVLEVETVHSALCLDLTKRAADTQQMAVLTARQTGPRSAREWDRYAAYLMEAAERACAFGCKVRVRLG